MQSKTLTKQKNETFSNCFSTVGDIREIEKKLGYTFFDRSLFQQALTHDSCGKKYNYERLEFLGDRVLSLIISTSLFANTNDDEGVLTRKLAFLVNKKAIGEIAEKLELGNHVKTKFLHINKKSLIVDICEAIIGAIYLESGLEVVNRIVLRVWRDKLKHVDEIALQDIVDFKSRLQVWSQKHNKSLPKYEMLKSFGLQHKLIFLFSVRVKGVGEATASGTTKQQAQTRAAAKFLRQYTYE